MESHRRNAVISWILAVIHGKKSASSEEEPLKPRPVSPRCSPIHFYSTVAGVNYNNNDGISRQEILKIALKRSGGTAMPAKLERIEYDGAPAVRVNTRYGCIGYIWKTDLPEVLPILKEIDHVDIQPEAREDEYTGEISYRAKIDICYFGFIPKPTATTGSLTPPDNILTSSAETGVFGVTHKNIDGTDRQHIIRRLFEKCKNENKNEVYVRLERYDLSSRIFVNIVSSGGCIGEIAEAETPNILKKWDTIAYATAEPVSFASREGNTMYTVHVSIFYNDAAD